MNKIYLILIIALVGCTTIAERKAVLRNALNSYLHKSRDVLIKSRGVPATEYPLDDGGEMLEYNYTSTETKGGSIYPMTIAGSTTWITNPSRQIVHNCKITFFTNSQRIVKDWKYSGDNCF